MQDNEPLVAIIGAGMSGILMGIRLKEAGIDRFRIFEKASSVGGTWRENTYPGLACDVPSFFYSYSFETNRDWSHRFAPGPEIRAYFERVAEKYDLRPHIRFDSEVCEARYEAGRWSLETRDGERTTAKFLVMATGPLHHKHIPEIEGLDRFAGDAFHTAAWDHDASLAGKRIGLIGTGSTAIQTATPLADTASELTIFQRTAQWIFPIDNEPYSEAQRARKHRFPVLARLTRLWYKRLFELSSQAVVRPGWARRNLDKSCRDHLQTVGDPELRRKLTPDYAPGCKRLVMSGEFYSTVQRKNVNLEVSRIHRIEPEGVRTEDGALHELDVLVLATGFEPHAWGVGNVVGSEGKSLAQAWKDGTRTYRSIAMPGFPNLFFLAGPQSPLGNISVIDISETEAEYVLTCMRKLEREGLGAIEVTHEATQAFNDAVVDAMKDTVWVTGCDSWYLDGEGTPVLWPWTARRFHRDLKHPDYADFALHPASGEARSGQLDQQ
jgi:cation diffusion facilitator CzcD-associated flavoprotein CzcO